MDVCFKTSNSITFYLKNAFRLHAKVLPKGLDE
jgi:hypothetical protein